MSILIVSEYSYQGTILPGLSVRDPKLKLTKKLFSRSKYSQFLGPRGPLMCSTFDSCPRFVPKILKNWQQEVLPIAYCYALC